MLNKTKKYCILYREFQKVNLLCYFVVFIMIIFCEKNFVQTSKKMRRIFHLDYFVWKLIKGDAQSDTLILKSVKSF